MKFEYAPVLFSDGSWGQMPNVRAYIGNPKNDREEFLFPLIDSGAALSLLNRQYAKRLGINIKSGKRTDMGGVGGDFHVYEHDITVRILGIRQVLDIRCGIAANIDTPTVLGQPGFFEAFKITFERYNKTFSVTAKR